MIRARAFELQDTLAANVRELRRALGSISKPLSLRDFAKAIEGQHPTRKIDFKMIERWEEGTEPDTVSTAIMANMAGVDVMSFVLGKNVDVFEISPGSIDFRREDLIRLTDEQLQRAREVAARERDASDPPAPKARAQGGARTRKPRPK